MGGRGAGGGGKAGGGGGGGAGGAKKDYQALLQKANVDVATAKTRLRFALKKGKNVDAASENLRKKHIVLAHAKYLLKQNLKGG